MKKALVLLTCAMALSLAVFGQVGSTRVSADNGGKQSIVREWTNGHSVAFSLFSDGQGSFLLIEDDVFNCQRVALPQDYVVSDFEILDDTVYFCGYYNIQGIHYGFIGCFDIEELFWNHTSFRLWNLVIGSSQYNIDYCMMDMPLRMDVYRYQGTIHIAVTGESIAYNGTNEWRRSSVLDVSLTNNEWCGSMYYNKDYNEYYYDVVATQNYLVASAGKPDGTGFFVRIFKKSANTICTPIMPGYLFQIGGGSVVGETLVERMGANKFVTSNHCSSAQGAGLAIKTFSISTTLPLLSLQRSLFFMQSSSLTVNTSWEIKELKYSLANRYLYLIQKMSYPISSTLTSAIMEFDMANVSSHTTMVSWIAGVDWYSLDRYSSSHLQAIGHDQNGDNILLFDKQSDFATLCANCSVHTFSENNQVSQALRPSNEDIESVYTRYNPPTLVFEEIDMPNTCNN